MRYFIAVLFSLSLLQITACGNTSESKQSSALPQKTMPAPTSSTAVPSMNSVEKEQKEELGLKTEGAQPAPEPTGAQPKAVMTSQKKLINESPEKSQSATEGTKPPPLPEDKATSPPAVGKEVQATPTEAVASIPKAPASAPSTSEVVKETARQPDHGIWNELLQKYVSPTGNVNYAGLKSDQAKLQNYLEELATNTIQSDWTRAEKMAYWINVYNAFTIKLILDNYPVNSITTLHGGKPWDVKWIKLGDKTYSLNQVENDILRPQFKDARIHFAVNCAAKSCPPLLNRAWTADNLNTYLEKQTRAFINNPKYNTINSRKVNVSKIFEWYAADFGDLIQFLNKYSATSINKGATVAYQEYDWALNN